MHILSTRVAWGLPIMLLSFLQSAKAAPSRITDPALQMYHDKIVASAREHNGASSIFATGSRSNTDLEDFERWHERWEAADITEADRTLALVLFALLCLLRLCVVRASKAFAPIEREEGNDSQQLRRAIRENLVKDVSAVLHPVNDDFATCLTAMLVTLVYAINAFRELLALSDRSQGL